jgi:hypothetical protein
MNSAKLSLIALTSLVFTVLATPQASAQRVIQGQAVGSTAKATGTMPKGGGFEVVAPKINRAAAAAAPLQIWEVKQEGTVGYRRRHLAVGVTEITSYTDNRMRWSFYIWNKAAREDNAQTLFNKISVADSNGDSFTLLASQLITDFEGTRMPLPPGIKTKFWIDFDMPKEPTDTFKLNIPVYDIQAGAYTEFRAFTIKLNAPIPLPAEALKDDAPKENAPVGEVTAKPNTVPVAANAAPVVVPAMQKPVIKGKGVAKRDASLRMVAEGGKRYEGNMKPKPGLNFKGGVVFEKQVPGQLIKARLFIKSPMPRDIKLTGALVEDINAPGESALTMEDRDEVNYRFTLDGPQLLCKDSKGGIFVMFPAQ